MLWMRGLGWWRRRRAEATERRMASVYGGANTFHADGRYLAWGFDRATPDYYPNPDDPEVAEFRARLKDHAAIREALPPHTKIRHQGGRCFLVELREGPDPAEQAGLESITRFLVFQGSSVIDLAEVDLEWL